MTQTLLDGGDQSVLGNQLSPRHAVVAQIGNMAGQHVNLYSYLIIHSFMK